jgi:hypothetical protein
VTEGSARWKQSPPHKDAPEFDTFDSRDGDPWIVIGKRPLAGKFSLGKWIEKMTVIHAITYGQFECTAVEDDRATSLGGEKARIHAFHCPVDGPVAIAVQVLVTHNDFGWVAMCYSEGDEAGQIPAFEKQCMRWLSTFRFLS